MALWFYHEGKFLYSPGFVVETVDTTGAGDVFHGAFAYALLAGWDMVRTLDFSNAMAALNCTVLGRAAESSPGGGGTIDGHGNEACE